MDIKEYLGSVIFPANNSCHGLKTLFFKIDGLILIASISCFAISFVDGLPTICSLAGTFVPSGNSSTISSKDLFLRKTSTSVFDVFIISFNSGWVNLTLSTSCIDFPAAFAASHFLIKSFPSLFYLFLK